MLDSLDRVLGHYSISIATSLALEGVFETGEHENPNRKERPVKDKKLMVNIRTLMRNVVNAFSSTQRDELTSEIILQSMREDINGLIKAVNNAEPTATVEIYHCSFESANKHFGPVKFHNGKSVDEVVTSTARNLMRGYELDLFDNYDRLKEGFSVDFVEFDCVVKSDQPTILLTNYPSDLLGHNDMPSCILLESHTGRLKGESQWHTKLTGKPVAIPFTKEMWSIYGDGILIGPQPMKFRKVLNKLAEKGRWTHRTTMSRVKSAVSIAKEPHLLDFIRKFK